MKEELLVNVSAYETRVAAIGDGSLREIFIEQRRTRGIVGNIYRGRVVRVLPGMQAAFVDIGLRRTAFLHAADARLQYTKRMCSASDDNTSKSITDINALAREGQSIVVQVVKDPIGSKGARVTMQLSIASRYLVLLAGSNQVAVSQKIIHPAARERLKCTITELMNTSDLDAGYIVRTAAEGASVAALDADLLFLGRAWKDIREHLKGQVNGLLHEDLPLALRTVRDLFSESTTRIRIDDHKTYEAVRDFAQNVLPESVGRIEHYSGRQPIFDLFGVEDGIQRALSATVQLKSGGTLILEQTESMTTIDVNTGGYVGRQNLEETLFRTNLEAASAIVRELRVRNIGGIVIVDFIDMEEMHHRDEVVRVLKEALYLDGAQALISDISDLGLVQISRKRLRPSLERTMTEACSACAGSGFLKTAQTVCYEIFRELTRQAAAHESGAYTVVASPKVIEMLLDEEAKALADLQTLMRMEIHLQVDPLFSQETYDVVPM